jgi:hypothetical protein
MANEIAQEASDRTLKSSLESSIDVVPRAGEDDVGHAGTPGEGREKSKIGSPVMVVSDSNDQMSYRELAADAREKAEVRLH